MTAIRKSPQREYLVLCTWNKNRLYCSVERYNWAKICGKIKHDEGQIFRGKKSKSHLNENMWCYVHETNIIQNNTYENISYRLVVRYNLAKICGKIKHDGGQRFWENKFQISSPREYDVLCTWNENIWYYYLARYNLTKFCGKIKHEEGQRFRKQIPKENI